MKIEKLPYGNSYRVRKTYKGKTYAAVFDHKPSQKEALLVLSERMQVDDDSGSRKSFKNCGKEYIKSKDKILSPSTIRSYNTILSSSLSADFLKKNIYDISQLDIQAEINSLATDHKPKTVRNIHGFISAVFKVYRPAVHLSTTLPQKIKYEPYVPTEDDIKRILKASEGTKYHRLFELGILGLRRSEVCALQMSDIDADKNELHIDKALLFNENQKFVVVYRNKTTEGKRTIYIPDSLIEEINEAGVVCDVSPGTILENLHAYQKKLNIPEFRFHDLRHYYASYAHDHGMSDANIMATGGWKSDYTMKNIYRHAMEKSKKEKQKEIASSIFS